MAKRKAGDKKMSTAAEPIMRHARIELPEEDFERLQKQAKRFRLSVSAYLRQAAMKTVEADERTELRP